MLTNPDGHLQKENSEYIHWLVYVFQKSSFTIRMFTIFVHLILFLKL